MTLQMLKDAAMNKAKSIFKAGSAAGTWKAAAFHYRELLVKKQIDHVSRFRCVKSNQKLMWIKHVFLICAK